MLSNLGCSNCKDMAFNKDSRNPSDKIERDLMAKFLCDWSRWLIAIECCTWREKIPIYGSCFSHGVYLATNFQKTVWKFTFVDLRDNSNSVMGWEHYSDRVQNMSVKLAVYPPSPPLEMKSCHFQAGLQICSLTRPPVIWSVVTFTWTAVYNPCLAETCTCITFGQFDYRWSCAADWGLNCCWWFYLFVTVTASTIQHRLVTCAEHGAALQCNCVPHPCKRLERRNDCQLQRKRACLCTKTSSTFSVAVIVVVWIWI